MGTKTISLRDEAYERLRSAKRSPRESFSDVVMRAHWSDVPLSAGDYLQLVRDRGGLYAPDQLERMDRAAVEDRPPEDKWRKG
jgi:hypothetical protein